MKLQFNERTLTVIRENGDPKFYGIKNAAGESRLFYHIKKILNEKHGFNLIKKRMVKDGHLVDDMQQYLRPAKNPKDESKNISIFNLHWSIMGAEKDFNEFGEVLLCVNKHFF